MHERTHTPHQDEALRTLLITMADRLTHHEPTEPMTEADRLHLAGELTDYDEPHHGELLKASVRPAPGATRGEYAALLRQIAGVR